MPGPSKYEIRIVVKTDTSRNSDGQTCVVDTSKGLPSILEAVSSQVDFEVEELSLLSFKEHVVVASSISNPKLLRDLDIVLASPSDEAATPKQKSKSRGVHSSGPRRQIDEDSSVLASRSAGSSKKRKGLDGTTPMYSVGTKVRKKFDGHGWYEGSIISVSKKNKSYKVEYEDGDEEEYFFDEREIDKIVQQAESVEVEEDDDDSNDSEASRRSKSKKKRKTSSGTKAKYKVGTKVRRHFGQFGWSSGEITAIKLSENKYEILYSDGDDQSINFDDPEIDEIVENAKNDRDDDPPSTKASGGKGKRKRAASAKNDASSKKNVPKFNVGTKVRKKFKGHGWFEGEIISMNTKKGSYKVQYSDGDKEEFFFDEPDIDKLVEHAINNTGEGDDDDVDDDDVEEEQVEPVHKRSGNSWLPEDPLLTDTERGQLKGKTIDLDEMKQYLAKEWFLKAKSVTNVLLQVRKLMGDGISNQNWPKDVVFKPKSIADLSEDYFQILQDAMSHEAEFGKIPTERLRNPLIKLVFYQEFVYKKNFPNLPSSSKETTPKAKKSGEEPEGGVPDDESVENIKVQDDPVLTEEQRSQLKGKQFDLDDFKKYLGKEWFVTSKSSLMSASSRVKKLMNGEGIAYKHWPEGVEFRADPILDLSSNFYDMKQKAVAHEEKYGATKGSTTLTNFMTRLVYYQHYLYEKDLGDSQENAANDDGKTQDAVKGIEAAKDNEKKPQVQLHKPLLTDSQREQLKGIKIDLKALEKYLVDELDHDANFVKAVKSKVTRLMNGDGISYKNWDSDFHPEALTDMSANLYQMQQDALSHEEKYGEDKSNGKVIRYPLYKLEMYQQYLYDKNFGSTKESAPITEEQRKQLSGVELEMEDFEGFLGLDEDLKKGEAKKIVQQVKLLTGGKGVRCKEWDKGILFHPPPTEDLSEDFGEMLEDAKEYEEKYGEDKSGGQQLRIPINMLIKYQAYNYKTLNEKEGTTDSKTAAAASEGGANGIKSKNEASSEEDSNNDKKEDSSNDDAAEALTDGQEPPLTNEQLRVLKGDKIDMDDFEAYLVKKGGFPQVKRRVLVENVKRLVNGEGIPYKQGEKDVVFKCQRITDLSVNLHKILQRAIKDEKKAGDNSKNQAESDLQNPLRNFMNYQRECYEDKKKKNGGKSTSEKPPTETKKDPKKVPRKDSKKDNAPQDKGRNCMEVSESEAVV